MKKIIFTLFALLTLFTACKNVDDAVVGQLQQNITSLEQAVTTLKESSTTLGLLTNQIDGLPENVKNNATGYSDLKEKANSISNRIAVRTYEYGNLATQMRTLAADYTAGKMKTPDVQNSLNLLNDRIKDAPVFVEGVQKNLADIQASIQKFQ